MPELSDAEDQLLGEDLAEVKVEASHPQEDELIKIIDRINNQPVLANFEECRDWYTNHVEGRVTCDMSTETADRLCKVLMGYSGSVEGGMLSKRPTEEGLLALELFHGFVTHVDAFQDCVETYSATELGAKLKLERHLLDADNDHKFMVSELIAFLSSNYPKFKDWKTYVRPEAHPVVESYFGDLPADSFEISAPRLSSSMHLPPEGNYYDTEIDQLIEVFHTDLKKGLATVDVKHRQERYGTNALPKSPPPSILRMLLNQLLDFIVMCLLVAAVISAALQDYIATGALLVVVAVNTIIGFSQEWKAERALAALQSLEVPFATCMRDGERVDVNSEQMVPGDIVILEEGDMIPADIRLFEAVNLQIIESILTGESVPIEKKTEALKERNLAIGDRKNMAFMSTVVTKGRGAGIVVATGKNTEVGKISKALADAGDRKTGLQKKLARLGKWLVVIAVFLCVLVFIIGNIRMGHFSMEMLHVSISLAVSVIPEGLVAVVTITFAMGVSRMLKRNAIIRRLPAVETLGSVTTICSDKTGTLTEGKMNCKQIYCGGELFDLTGTGIIPEGDIMQNDTPISGNPAHLELVCRTAALCNNSGIKENSEDASGWVPLGDPTEVAMVVATYKAGLNKQTWLDKGWEFVNESPFDSERKRMTVVYSFGGNNYIMTKGAPEMVTRRCTRVVTHGDKVDDMTEEHRGVIEQNAADMAARGMRVLALGFREENSDIDFGDAEQTERDLTFAGLMGMIDPPREEVKDAVSDCYNAGIKVIMITGDHPTTAKTIAIDLGIIPEGKEKEEGIVMKGLELDTLSQEELVGLETFPCVFARVSPQNKLQIVEALQQRGEVVGMTGDGVNDAPAIKQANMGIAMGMAGTDLTKQSADMILVDDNFATIVAAVEEGRRTYDNIRKFIMYLLSANSSEIFVMLFAVTFLPVPERIPFTAVMILWANLFADIPPAMALGVDPAEPNVLKRRPRDPAAGVFNTWTAAIVLYQGLSMALISLVDYVIAMWVHNYSVIVARSVIYACLTSMQMWHAFLSRSVKDTVFRRNLFTNRWLWGGVTLSMFLLILGIYLPGLNTILELAPIPLYEWAVILVACAVHTCFVELMKFELRLKDRFSDQTGLFYSDV